MKGVGIIAEYNPIHSGHVFHIQETKKHTGADVVIAVISGNFTQRGEPAFLDKWTRAKMAVLNGVDLCLEMPGIFATSSAEQFAEAGVKILDGIGGVEWISFGCENKDEEVLKKIADILVNEPKIYKETLRLNLDKGLSFPKSRENAILALTQTGAKSIGSANNILAVEYLKWLTKLNSNIKPVLIERNGLSHYKSATEIRNIFSNIKIDEEKDSINYNNFDDYKDIINKSTYNVILDNIDHIVKKNNVEYFNLIRYSILQKTPEELSRIYGCREGLENRIFKVIRKANSLEELVEEIISKRYTETSINRLILSCLLGYDENLLNSIRENMYTRVLAFNEKGRTYLKEIKKKELSTITILSNIERDDKTFYKEIKTTDIYNICSKKSLYMESDFVKHPILVE